MTAWIPLQPVPRDMGPVANSGVDDSPYALGDVSCHSGWTFHRADANDTDEVRAAFTIIYMDKDMKVEQKHPRQRVDLALWVPGTRSGDPAAIPINPVLYER